MQTLIPMINCTCKHDVNIVYHICLIKKNHIGINGINNHASKIIFVIDFSSILNLFIIYLCLPEKIKLNMSRFGLFYGLYYIVLICLKKDKEADNKITYTNCF